METDFSEAIDRLIQAGADVADATHKASDRVTFEKDPHDDRVYFSIHDGKLDERIVPNFRRHKVADLDSLVAAVSRFGNKTDDGPESTLWIADSGISFLVDDSDRRDRVSMPLSMSTARAAIVKSIINQNVAQKQLVWLLRTDLRFAITKEELLDKVKSIKWSRNSDGESQVDLLGKESLRNDTVSRIEGTGELPEQVTASFAWWEELPFAVEVDLAVAVNNEDQAFRFQPIAGSLAKAQQQALTHLRSAVETMLAEVDANQFVSVFCGEC